MKASDFPRGPTLRPDRRSRFGPLCGPPLDIWFDEDCGICQFTVRWLRPLDGGRRLTFWGYTRGDGSPVPVPTGFTAEELEERRSREIVVELMGPTGPTGRVLGGGPAMVQILAALPVLRFLVWPLRLPGLAQLVALAYRAVARNRRQLSGAVGLNACRVRPPPVTPKAP